MDHASSKKRRFACIGGGAAGFFSALTLARLCPDAEVIILEKTRQPLSKVKISGGGRCNVTHSCFDPSLLSKNYPRGEAFLKKAFYTFQPKDMMQWLEGRGVPLKTEADGRIFPSSNSSSSVINCFVKEAEALGVKVILEAEVVSIERAEAGLMICCRDKEKEFYDAALLATGGMSRSYHLAEMAGHTPIPAVPSLFTFQIADPRLEGISGVSVPCAIASIASEKLQAKGPILITHWGLSGPAILRLSAWGARVLAEKQYNTEVKINWLGDMEERQVKETLLSSRSKMGSQKVAMTPLFSLPKSLWKKLTDYVLIDEDRVYSQLTKEQMQALQQALIQSTFTVQGKSTNKDEFVTCGGVSLKEIDHKTMQSLLCPHLYFAGEVIDIDGITGGFNFQNAWTSAWIAAHAMAKSS